MKKRRPKHVYSLRLRTSLQPKKDSVVYLKILERQAFYLSTRILQEECAFVLYIKLHIAMKSCSPSQFSPFVGHGFLLVAVLAITRILFG